MSPFDLAGSIPPKSVCGVEGEGEFITVRLQS